MAKEMLQPLSQDEIEQARFRSRRMFEMDQQHNRIIAQREGRAEGLAEGRAEGLAEGRAEGLAEGRAEGKAEGEAEGIAKGEAKGRTEIALKLKKTKVLSDEEISQVTGLSLSEVEELK